ncbi:MAG: AAA domain-containing protein [Actinomycetota bacterium]|nr:AAA domain-containing protein [Actinomycetota bacterium]
MMSYFHQLAEEISICTDDGKNILGEQYKKIKTVSDKTILPHYFDPDTPIETRALPDTLIYPFGLNESQKTAVENAFSSQISIIQGPPGTGKTQTVLNIVANVILKNKTIAVVSNNNYAISNVLEKLDKYGLSFFAASLGKQENKKNFVKDQTGKYPNMKEWALKKNVGLEIYKSIKKLNDEINNMLSYKNRIAIIKQNLSELKTQQHYFSEYFQELKYKSIIVPAITSLSSKKLESLRDEFELLMKREKSPGIWQKLIGMFKYGISSLSLYKKSVYEVIPFLKKQLYETKIKELNIEKAKLDKKMKNYRFDDKLSELTKMSMKMIKAILAKRFNWRGKRKLFGINSFRKNSSEFNKEYPLILSTTYSIKNTLSKDHIYDYLVIDEASQVDVVTGVLAFTCAKNVVIIGDQKQLPNIVGRETKSIADDIWKNFNFNDAYKFSEHSLLSSAKIVWNKAPEIMLREHYRCHPKIANFFSKEFYNGQLIIMTEDHGEDSVLRIYRTVAGSHARGHYNQRQIDIIEDEAIPYLVKKGFTDIGLTSPYNEQINAIKKKFGVKYEMATIHKFQGREKESIILTTVDNVIKDFVKDPNLINVAVSRAEKNFSVIISSDERNDETIFGDLARYIEYNNFEIVDSNVWSVFDLLYKCNSEQRKIFVKRHKRVSEFDSENIIYNKIESILSQEPFQKINLIIHMQLNELIKDNPSLTDEERKFFLNPLAHVDFLIFDKMNKTPKFVVEVDGYSFHLEGTKQAKRDALKNSILKKCDIPILRLRTNESGIRERIIKKLYEVI